MRNTVQTLRASMLSIAEIRRARRDGTSPPSQAPAPEPSRVEAMAYEELREYRDRMVAEKQRIATELEGMKARQLPQAARADAVRQYRAIEAMLPQCNARLAALRLAADAERKARDAAQVAAREASGVVVKRLYADPAMAVPAKIIVALLDIIDRYQDSGAPLTDMEIEDLDGAAKWLEMNGAGDR